MISGAFLSSSMTDLLKDLSLVAGTIVIVAGAIGLITRYIMKKFIKWLTDSIEVLLEKRLQPIEAKLKKSEDSKDHIIEILHEMQSNGGETIKDKVDKLYNKMIREDSTDA